MIRIEEFQNGAWFREKTKNNNNNNDDDDLHMCMLHMHEQNKKKQALEARLAAAKERRNERVRISAR